MNDCSLSDCDSDHRDDQSDAEVAGDWAQTRAGAVGCGGFGRLGLVEEERRRLDEDLVDRFEGMRRTHLYCSWNGKRQANLLESGQTPQ